MKKYLSLIYALLLICCTNQHTTINNNIRTVTFFYIVGNTNSNIAIPLSDFKNMSLNFKETDTIYISTTQMDRLCNILCKAVKNGREEESHVVTTVMIIDTLDIYIGAWDTAFDLNYERFDISEYDVYWLYSISEYYNYWSKLNLPYCRLIEKYGVPANYRDIRREADEKENREGVYPKRERYVKKILMEKREDP